MDRRDFIRHTGVTAAALTLAGTNVWAAPVVNPLPRWKGFNLLDFFSPDPKASRAPTHEEYFKWMRDWGFDFVRIPMAYPYYLNIDRAKNITPDDVYKIDTQAVDKIDSLVSTAHKYNMHVSLNLHRAPGYCVNAGFYEPYNLWKDQAALDAFCFHWNMWARRYKNVSRSKISFDLVNEPSTREDMNDQLSKRTPVPGDVYRRVAKAAADVIRRENPDHLVIADGNDVGSKVIPEITDLNIAQSCRGYYPGNISHYKAPWAVKDPEHQPAPTWPGKDGDKYVDRAALEEYYKPWAALVEKGVGVHCGECGCWKETPHGVMLAWFNDVADVLTSHKIGYALWEFVGTFGIVDSQRKDVAYEDWYGHKLDRKYLEILMKH
jgi:aryl-phospho-beta-D-glucosidase BglC (GH1 family)